MDVRVMSMAHNADRYKFKIVVVGEHATGKTSLIRAFVEQKFNADYRPTIGTDIYIKKLDLDGVEVTLTIFDIAGQERWANMRSLYYKGAAGALVVGDLTRAITFEQITKFWVPDMEKQMGRKVPFVLIANKTDLPREASKEVVEGCATVNGAVATIETSAKTGTAVNNAFKQIAKALITTIPPGDA